MMEHPLLIPRPVTMAPAEGSWELCSKTVVSYNQPSARPAAELFAAQLRLATGFALPVCESKSSSSGRIAFTLSEEGPPEAEGYTLKVAQPCAAITARTPAGLFYGAQTLRQLFPPEIFKASTEVVRAWKIPCVAICDFPTHGWRGMHLDVSRHFLPLEDVFRFIDTIASLKFNRFHWHLTDDQGWRIEIKRYPELTGKGAWRKQTLIGHGRQDPAGFVFDGTPHGGFYTQEEIRKAVIYAAERHITIVPEIDMPGHMQAAIAAYPQFGSGTEPVEVRTIWGISSAVLNPEEATVRFCQDILTEVIGLFPGELIHVGGDEVEKTEWEASERIQQLRRERGLKDMAEMQSWFLGRIHDFLRQNGRRLIGWDEILESVSDNGATVMAWRSEERGATAARAGHPVVMASRNLYFDYYQAEPVENEPLAIGGFAPMEKVYEYDPIPDGLSLEETRWILGAQGQLWTEYMSDARHVEYMAFPRACALAETLWTPKSQKDYGDFLHRLPAALDRLDCAGVNYRRPESREKPLG